MGLSALKSSHTESRIDDTPIKQRAELICHLLEQNYGNIVSSRSLPPVDELVLTILSQNTNDVNSGRAYTQLKRVFPDWEDLLRAATEEIEDAIRSSGFFRIKARRIKDALSEIKRRVGKIDLSLLESMSTTDAKEWLTSLYGVGPKTASIVLLFSFGRPTLPVDTHVWRVTKRLGLVPSTATRESAQIILEQLISTECVKSLNHNLIRHGRDVCSARRPMCSVCFLKAQCDYYAAGSSIFAT